MKIVFFILINAVHPLIELTVLQCHRVIVDVRLQTSLMRKYLPESKA